MGNYIRKRNNVDKFYLIKALDHSFIDFIFNHPWNCLTVMFDNSQHIDFIFHDEDYTVEDRSMIEMNIVTDMNIYRYTIDEIHYYTDGNEFIILLMCGKYLIRICNGTNKKVIISETLIGR